MWKFVCVYWEHSPSNCACIFQQLVELKSPFDSINPNMYVRTYVYNTCHMAVEFDVEFNLIIWQSLHQLSPVNFNFLDTLYCQMLSFCQIKNNCYNNSSPLSLSLFPAMWYCVLLNKMSCHPCTVSMWLCFRCKSGLMGLLDFLVVLSTRGKPQRWQ